jgi:hypothetical protein
MSVGLSLLTAWGLRRFADLSRPYSVTEIAPIYQDLIARVLGETFWVAGGALFLTVALAVFLRRRQSELLEAAVLERR